MNVTDEMVRNACVAYFRTSGRVKAEIEANMRRALTAALSFKAVDEEGMTKITEPYVIQKGAHFYRPNRAGYTAHIEAAGIYTREDAEREAGVEPNTISAIPLEHFRPTLQRTFDAAKTALDAINANLTAALSKETGVGEETLREVLAEEIRRVPYPADMMRGEVVAYSVALSAMRIVSSLSSKWG